MANRVTGTEVKTIITTQKTADQVESFITPANLIVTGQLGSLSLGDALMKEIEKWLSAHFVAIDDSSARVEQKKVGDASTKYEGKTDMGLKFTRYGQQVMMLDTSGTLSNLGKRRAAVKTII